MTENPIHELYENINTVIHHLNDRAKRLRELAIRDSLTSLYNRHFFNEVIQREITRAVRSRESLSFVMVDVDHLKRINDTQGHMAGDRMLVEMAELLRNQCRKSDLIFRLGGDEFMLFLTNTNRPKAKILTQRIEKAILTWNQKHAKHFGDTMSVSMGIACGRPHEGLELMKKADQIMYAQKRSKHLKQAILSSLPTFKKQYPVLARRHLPVIV
jgi:diguanylate cyclase (GGDEF)-like protein